MKKEMNYSILPEHMQEGMKRYVEYGVNPGDFLYHIICNDFVHALVHADQINMARIVDYAKFLYFEAPSGCWGSVEKVNNWRKARKEEALKAEELKGGE